MTTSQWYPAIEPQCQLVLEKYFNIIGVFDLIPYRLDMSKLYNDLIKIKKSEYDPNDRIIFTLFDHDYHLNGKGPGWILYNLQIILSDLDISNFFCLILTNQDNFNNYTKEVQHQLTSDDFHIRSITTMINYEWMPPAIVPTSCNFQTIEKPFCVLSRQARPWRTFFIAKLFDRNLQNKGLIGYHNIEYVEGKSNNNKINHKGNSLGLFEIPQNHQRLNLKNKQNVVIYNNFKSQFDSYKNFTEDLDLHNKKSCVSWRDQTPVVQGFLYIGLETEIKLENPHVSKISLRGIAQSRPFVLFAAPGSLSYLRRRGFKTFDEFWCEDYDTVTDPETRIDLIIDIVEYISSMSLKELESLYNKMQPIIEYNHNFFYNELINRELRLLDQNCKTNLKNVYHTNS